MIYGNLGDSENWRKWIRASYDERSGLLTYLKCVSWYDSLRSDPVYEELVRKVGLPEVAVAPAQTLDPPVSPARQSATFRSPHAPDHHFSVPRFIAYGARYPADESRPIYVQLILRRCA